MKRNATYTIEDSKLNKVVEIINQNTDPAATEELIGDVCLYDWPEGREHQEWLDSASPEEIANWIAAVHY